MNKIVIINSLWILILLNLCSTVRSQASELTKIFGSCHKSSPEFDSCIKNGFNKLRPFFKTGIPEYNIASFDPHHAEYVEQRRGLTKGLVGGYRLLLSDVSEFGWTNSLVTKYKTDWENNKFIYSQDFPEKSLTGLYDFKASILGQNVHTKGEWNMTLYDYAQTTSVTRIGGPGGLLKVRVEIDRLGDLKMKISDLFNGRKGIENCSILKNVTKNIILTYRWISGYKYETTADFLINNMWRPGFPFLKPLINELVSTAFTDIFNESFRYFPVDNFIKD